MVVPLEMVIFPIQHLMYASEVASQVLPNITGFPLDLSLLLRTRKSVGYSQESTETIISSMIPFGLVTYISASSSIMGVGLGSHNPRRAQAFNAMILIADPKSTKVFGKLMPHT